MNIPQFSQIVYFERILDCVVSNFWKRVIIRARDLRSRCKKNQNVMNEEVVTLSYSRRGAKKGNSFCPLKRRSCQGRTFLSTFGTHSSRFLECRELVAIVNRNKTSLNKLLLSRYPRISDNVHFLLHRSPSYFRILRLSWHANAVPTILVANQGGTKSCDWSIKM